MKIDLHVHTKKTESGEPKTVNIKSVEHFVQKLINNNVRIVGITNHNEFDCNQFNKINEYYNNKKNIDKHNKILFLPGVELRIYYKNDEKYKHLNVIISNENDINAFAEEIKKYNEKSKKPTIDDLTEIFNEKIVLLYIDTKRNERTWTDEEYQTLKKEIENKKLKNKFVVIGDVVDLFSFLRYRARNLEVLIGSNVRDWDKYDENAKKLLDMNINIDSFDMFLKTYAYNEQQTFENLFNEEKKKATRFDDLKININTDKKGKNEVLVGNLKVFNGINVIFGPKASGKTLLMKAMDDLMNKERKKSLFYSSDEKNKIINNYFSEHKNEFQKENEDEKKILISYLKKIKEFKEYVFDDWTRLKSSFGKNYNWILSCFQIKNKIDPDKNKKNFLKSSIKYINLLISLIIKNENEKYSEELKFLKKFLKKLNKKYIQLMKDWWKNKLYNGIINKLNDLSISINGKEVSVTEIGLFSRWKERYNFLENLNDLKKEKWIYQKCIKTISLPDRGNIELVLTKKSLNFKDISEDIISISDDNKEDWMRGKKQKLLEFKKILDIKNCQNYSKQIEKKDVKELLDYLIDNPLIIKEEKIDSNKNNIRLSNGEEAILALLIILEKDNEYFFLDEPDSYLNTKSIFDFLIKNLWDKSKLNKKIIITTHNPVLAINSLPFNMIYRDKENFDNYFTFQGNPWTKEFVNIKNKKESKNFSILLLEQFETEIKHFKFRGEIYESGNK